MSEKPRQSGLPDDPRLLLGGYATGTLTEAERAYLMEAALEDQELFDELHDEAVLKQILDQPEMRQRMQAAVAGESRPSVVPVPGHTSGGPSAGPEAWWANWFRWEWATAAAATAAIVAAVWIAGVGRQTSQQIAFERASETAPVQVQDELSLEPGAPENPPQPEATASEPADSAIEPLIDSAAPTAVARPAQNKAGAPAPFREPAAADEARNREETTAVNSARARQQIAQPVPAEDAAPEVQNQVAGIPAQPQNQPGGAPQARTVAPPKPTAEIAAEPTAVVADAAELIQESEAEDTTVERSLAAAPPSPPPPAGQPVPGAAGAVQGFFGGAGAAPQATLATGTEATGVGTTGIGAAALAYQVEGSMLSIAPTRAGYLLVQPLLEESTDDNAAPLPALFPEAQVTPGPAISIALPAGVRRFAIRFANQQAGALGDVQDVPVLTDAGGRITLPQDGPLTIVVDLSE